MYENEWKYIGEKSLYKYQKKGKGAHFLLKFPHFNENTLKKIMFNGLLTVYFLKCMIQYADFAVYFKSDPI